MKDSSGQRGAALLLVLLITAAMTALVAEVISAVHFQAGRTSNFIDGQKAALASEDGIELARRHIEGLSKDYTYLGSGTWAASADGGTLELAVEDESGKLPVNSVVFPNGEINEAGYGSYRLLLGHLGLDKALSEPLADWLDMDDTERQGGAEGPGFYGRLNPPYDAKNGRLDTAGELALIKGYSDDMAERLAHFVSVYSDGLVNINTAPKEVLLSLSERITPEMAARLIERRDKRPFRHTSEIREVDGFDELVFSLQGRIKVKSDTFRIFSKASSNGAIRETEAVVRTGAGSRILYWRER